MSRISHLWIAATVALLLLALCLMTLGGLEVALASPRLASDGAVPVGGFVPDGFSVNITGQPAASPSLEVQEAISAPWVAYVQNGRVLAAKWDASGGAWTQQDGALNRSLANEASRPSLDFAGALPWVAWAEATGNAQQINAAWFNGSNWSLTPILNRNPAREADQPTLVAGATISSAEPLPWVAWTELTSDFSQIAVSRAVADASAQGGYRWEVVGEPFSFASALDAQNPDLAFAGANNTTPWVVWQEAGAGAPSRIYARRLVTGVWQTVGRQENCGNSETACALNFDPQRAAGTAHIAAGQLTSNTLPLPWIVFAEASASGTAIRVMKLDIGTVAAPNDDRFIPVGGSVNSQCLGRSGLTGQGGSEPDIYFVGNVLHVAWVENQGGASNLFVCHLADVRPGQERWDLDSNFPINRQLGALVVAPSLGANGQTPYLAWQEGSVQSIGQSNIYVAHRSPAGPAWGRNYPPFIRTISWSREILVTDLNVTSALEQTIQETVTNEFTLTTACYHAEGWQHIEEIQFKIANEELIVFLGKFVAAENKLYVADADGAFTAPGFTPGTGQQIVTDNVILNTAQTVPRSHGDDSPTLDIDWVMSFRSPTMSKDFQQSINLVYNGGQKTGFFVTGELSFDYRAYLPTVAN